MRAAVLVFGFLCCAPAAWAERRELAMGVQPMFAAAYLPKQAAQGGGGIAHMQYGVTDAVSILVFGGASYHAVSALPDDKQPEGSLLSWHANVGVSYALDIVRIQPFFEAAVGLFAQNTQIGKDRATRLDAGVSVGVGADYLLSRRVSFGFVFRYHGIVTDLGNIPLYLTVGPRIQLRFWP